MSLVDADRQWFKSRQGLDADELQMGPVLKAAGELQDQEDRQACQEAGMNDFVAKPFDPENLFSVVAKWLP